MKYLFIFLFIPASLSAQLSISFNTGYGLYNMSDIKDFQKTLDASFPVDAKITSSFPGYWYYDGSIKMTFDNGIIIGGSYGYASTGGRIYYSDYSGSISSDQLLYCYSFTSAFGFAKNYKHGMLVLQGNLNPGFTFTNLEVDVNETIGDESTFDVYKFRSTNITIQPTISITRRIWHVGLTAGLGYHQTVVPGKLKFQDENDTYLTDQSGNLQYADWSGLRMSLGVSYYFRKLPKSEKK